MEGGNGVIVAVIISLWIAFVAIGTWFLLDKWIKDLKSDFDQQGWYNDKNKK